MAEITYILEEMKNMPDKDDSPFESAPSHFDDDKNSSEDKDSNMPATLEELGDIMGLIIKNRFKKCLSRIVRIIP